VKWTIEDPIHTGEKEGWVPQAFGNAAVFRYGRGLYGWDLQHNKKLWQKDLLDDARHGNKQSTACGGYYATFSDVSNYKKPGPVFAVDPLTGETVWRTLVEAHCGGFEEGITASNDAIFYHGEYEPDKEWNLIKLDPGTGEQIWKKPGLPADQVIWRDQHLFFGGNNYLFVMTDDGGIVKKFDTYATKMGWKLWPGAGHTILAGYKNYETDRWELHLIDTRTLEILGEIRGPIGHMRYVGGFRRGCFATIANKGVALFDALKGEHIRDRFIESAFEPEMMVATPYGYAVLYNDNEINCAKIAFLDEKTGDALETVELNGRATTLYWLDGRLVAFYFEDLYLLTPE
jgi:outer membrane protein assembly factor BamB